MSAFDNIILPQQKEEKEKEKEKPTSLYATAFDNLNFQEPQKPLEPIKATPTKYRSAFDNLNLTGLSQEPLQPLSEKYTVAELRDNKNFNTRAERFLEGLGSNEDIFEYLRDSEYSLSSAMVRSLQTGKWTNQQKEDYVYLRDMFRNADLKSTRERLRAAKDITIDIVADPLNLLSVLFAIPTMGGSLATRAGANELVKQGIKRYNVSQLGKAGLQGAKRPAIYGAAEGAAWVGPYEYFSQSTDIDLGVRDDVDWNQVGAMTALGGILGGTVTGALGGISAAKYFDKQFKYANEQEALDAAKKFVGPLNEEDATKLKNEVEVAETIDNFNIKRSMTERLIAASVGKPTTGLLSVAEKSKPTQAFLDVLRYDVRRLLGPRKEGVKEETFPETLGRLQGFFHYNLENSLNMIWKTGIFAKLDADQNRQLMVLFANPKAKTYKDKPIDPEVKEAFFGSSKRMGLKNLLDIGFSKGNEYGMFALNQKVTNYFPHKISHSKLAANPEGFAEKLIKYKHAEPINEIQEQIFVDTTGKQVKGFELNQLSIDAALFKNKQGEGRDFLAEAGVPVRGDKQYALLEDATEFQLNQARQAKAKAIVDNMLERRWTPFELQSPNQVGNGYGFMKHRVFTNIPDDEMFDYIETDVRLVLQDYFTNLSQGLARTIHFGKTREDFRKKFIQPIREDLLAKKVNREEVEKIIERVEDMYGYATGVDIPRINNPILRGMSDWGRLTQQMAHLPLATISSITEPLLLLARVGVTDSPAAVGEIAHALKKETVKTFDRAIKGIQRAAGKKTRGIKDLEDAEWKELYETGLALEQAVMDRIEGLTGDALTGSVAKNLQNVFFKTNLLTQWTSAVQLASFNVGKKLIRRNIERLYKDEEGIVKLNATTKKYLQDQLEDLDVNPKLGLAWHRANMKTGAFDFGKASQADFYTKDIVNGANRFTKEIILNPSAAEANRPLWFGSPAGQLLMQFAGYPTVFTNTILKRFVTDSKDYPLQTTPKILGTTMLMTSVAMMGNYIRSGGRNWEEQEPGELVYEGIRRWGGVGFWEYADRLQTNVDLGGGQAASLIKSFAGPLGQDAIDMLIYRKGLAELATTNLPAYSALPKEVRDALKKRGREADKVLLEFLKSEEMSKLPGFSRGGSVNVPQAIDEPDERINPYTGEPYNATSESVQDVEDRALKGQMSRLTASKGGDFMNWVGEKFGIDVKTQRQHELESALVLNEQIDKGLIPENQRVLLDETGKYIKKSTPAFNELNHRLFGAKFGTDLKMKTLIQGRELIQSFSKPIDSRTDFLNNKLGFDALKQTGDYEEAKKLLVEKTIEDYANEIRKPFVFGGLVTRFLTRGNKIVNDFKKGKLSITEANDEFTILDDLAKEEQQRMFDDWLKGQDLYVFDEISKLDDKAKINIKNKSLADYSYELKLLEEEIEANPMIQKFNKENPEAARIKELLNQKDDIFLDMTLFEIGKSSDKKLKSYEFLNKGFVLDELKDKRKAKNVENFIQENPIIFDRDSITNFPENKNKITPTFLIKELSKTEDKVNRSADSINKTLNKLSIKYNTVPSPYFEAFSIEDVINDAGIIALFNNIPKSKKIELNKMFKKHSNLEKETDRLYQQLYNIQDNVKNQIDELTKKAIEISNTDTTFNIAKVKQDSTKIFNDIYEFAQDKYNEWFNKLPKNKQEKILKLEKNYIPKFDYDETGKIVNKLESSQVIGSGHHSGPPVKIFPHVLEFYKDNPEIKKLDEVNLNVVSPLHRNFHLRIWD